MDGGSMKFKYKLSLPMPGRDYCRECGDLYRRNELVVLESETGERGMYCCGCIKKKIKEGYRVI